MQLYRYSMSQSSVFCLTKQHATKVYWGGGIAPRILDLGTKR